MTWAPTHGCVLSLPKRQRAKYGVRQEGSKPSPLFLTLQKDSYLFWIYLHGGGVVTVADYLLAQLEIGMKVHEAKLAMTLIRQCQKLMHSSPTLKFE